MFGKKDKSGDSTVSSFSTKQNEEQEQYDALKSKWKANMKLAGPLETKVKNARQAISNQDTMIASLQAQQDALKDENQIRKMHSISKEIQALTQQRHQLTSNWETEKRKLSNLISNMQDDEDKMQSLKNEAQNLKDQIQQDESNAGQSKDLSKLLQQQQKLISQINSLLSDSQNQMPYLGSRLQTSTGSRFDDQAITGHNNFSSDDYENNPPSDSNDAVRIAKSRSGRR